MIQTNHKYTKFNLPRRYLDYIRQHKLTVRKHKSIDKYNFGQFHNSFSDFLSIIYVRQFKNVFPEGQGFLEYFNQKHYYQGDFQYGVAYGNGVMVLAYEKQNTSSKGIGITRALQKATLKYIQLQRSLNTKKKSNSSMVMFIKGQINAEFQPHDKGIFTFNKESKWLNCKFHGQSIFKWKEGSIYEGQYQNGQKKAMKNSSLHRKNIIQEIQSINISLDLVHYMMINIKLQKWILVIRIGAQECVNSLKQRQYQLLIIQTKLEIVQFQKTRTTY